MKACGEAGTGTVPTLPPVRRLEESLRRTGVEGLWRLRVERERQHLRAAELRIVELESFVLRSPSKPAIDGLVHTLRGRRMKRQRIGRIDDDLHDAQRGGALPVRAEDLNPALPGVARLENSPWTDSGVNRPGSRRVDRESPRRDFPQGAQALFDRSPGRPAVDGAEYTELVESRIDGRSRMRVHCQAEGVPFQSASGGHPVPSSVDRLEDPARHAQVYRGRVLRVDRKCLTVAPSRSVRSRFRPPLELSDRRRANGPPEETEHEQSPGRRTELRFVQGVHSYRESLPA